MKVRLGRRAFWIWLALSVPWVSFILYLFCWTIAHNELRVLTQYGWLAFLGPFAAVAFLPPAVIYGLARFVETPKWRSRVAMLIAGLAAGVSGLAITPWVRTIFAPVTYWRHESHLRAGRDEATVSSTFACITSYRNYFPSDALHGGWQSNSPFPAFQIAPFPGDRTVFVYNFCPDPPRMMVGDPGMPSYNFRSVFLLVGSPTPKYVCSIRRDDDVYTSKDTQVPASDAARQRVIAAAAHIYAETPLGITKPDFPVKRQKPMYFGTAAYAEARVSGLDCGTRIRNQSLFDGRYFPPGLAEEFRAAVGEGR